MSKQQKIRYVFVKGPEKTIEGISSFEEAKKKAEEFPESETQRVRVRLRSRTGLWDVLVKTRREVKTESESQQPQRNGD